MRQLLRASRNGLSRYQQTVKTRTLLVRELSCLQGIQHVAEGTEDAFQKNSKNSKAIGCWPYAFGLAAAAAWLQEATCDAYRDGPHAILTDTRIKVMRAWSEVQQDLDRIHASMPFHGPLRRPRSPDVRASNGQISIKMQVQDGTDFKWLLSQLLILLGDQGSSAVVQEGKADVQVMSSGASQVFEVTNALGRMKAQLFMPLQQGVPEIELLVKDGLQVPLTDKEMATINSILQAAHGLQKSRSGNFQSFSHSYSSGGDARDLVGESLARVLAGIDSIDYNAHFNSMMLDMTRRLERALFPEQGIEEQMNGASEGFCLPKDDQLPEDLKDAQTATEDARDYGSREANEAVKQLQQLGAIVYPPGEKGEVDWGLLAGYEEQKELIEETLLLAMLHPEVYSSVANKTRRNGGSNRPRAVLFEGPPGCGKTTSARVLATQAAAPLVYVPVEAIASKWYGESEKTLGQIFLAAEKLDSCLVFLDEIDSLATSRGSEMHEATRRILGVLLRQLDGFEGKRSIVIGATNRKQDLDPALRSRFDTSIYFQLPNAPCRRQILSLYAQQLSPEELEKLALACEGMSGRDLRDVCEQAERRTASKIIRSKLPEDSTPSVEEYLQAATARQQGKSLTPKGLSEILGRLNMAQK